ncbi:hypothetical protein HOD88_00990 [archaeon]|jgi:hypothetical protein|nr:hypothetical protein [archaeon]
MIWQEGIYFDLWSVIHFLFGMVFGGIIIFKKVKPWKGFIFTLLVAIVWEMIEWVPEIISNQILDVLLAGGGFLLINCLSSKMDQKRFKIIFILLLSLFVAGNIWGWISIS